MKVKTPALHKNDSRMLQEHLPHATRTTPACYKNNSRMLLPHFLLAADRNFFSGTEIYFKALEIDFKASEIYFQGFEIVLLQAGRNL